MAEQMLETPTYKEIETETCNFIDIRSVKAPPTLKDQYLEKINDEQQRFTALKKPFGYACCRRDFLIYYKKFCERTIYLRENAEMKGTPLKLPKFEFSLEKYKQADFFTLVKISPHKKMIEKNGVYNEHILSYDLDFRCESGHGLTINLLPKKFELWKKENPKLYEKFKDEVEN